MAHRLIRWLVKLQSSSLSSPRRRLITHPFSLDMYSSRCPYEMVPADPQHTHKQKQT